ncbi:MAG TPA: sulfatase-like hydrolase/transferase [Kiritimatiellia bacterium]|nr:sulfatase-like hydrolase/transferase [Kiritimatiellia bacterium]HMO97608.1 sulfatase-like hydrolase/transferase [Kiritimatiellia bacterium]
MPSKTTTRTERPNIVFVITDDIERFMFNALPEGRGKNLTPHLDRLEREGVLMAGQHVASAVCTPSRFNVLTGLFASRALNVTEDEQAVVAFTTHIHPDDNTLPKRLQQAGYRTGMAGKNHVVHGPSGPDIPLEADPRDPEIQTALRQYQSEYEAAIRQAGFDFAGGIYPGNPDELRPRALRIHNMDYVTDAALRFIDQQDERAPFFLYFATTLPHGPIEPERSWDSDPLLTPFGVLDEPLQVLPPRASIGERIRAANLKTSGPDEGTHWAAEQAPYVMLAIDDALGALLARMESRGLLENTILFFFNDHGCDAKGTLYQGGLQFPSIAWRPGGFAAGSRRDDLVSNVDFAPTILDLAGIAYEPAQFDGVSFRDILEGAEQPADRTLYAEMGFSRTVRKGEWKYLALRYPPEAVNMPMEERRRRLEEWNDHLGERGIEPVNTDPAAPFSHLTDLPGGAHAEHSTTGKKLHYYDPDQLFNLADDPGENHNLAGDPAYAEKLAEMKELMRLHVQKLPGSFGEFK